MLDVKPRSRTDITLERRASRPRRDGNPRISVVAVVSDESAAALRELADRASHWQRLGVEFVIVGVKRQIVSTIMSGARMVYGPSDATTAQLRSLGLSAASGDVVVLLDGTASADDAWIEQLCASQTSRTEGPDA